MSEREQITINTGIIECTEEVLPVIEKVLPRFGGKIVWKQHSIQWMSNWILRIDAPFMPPVSHGQAMKKGILVATSVDGEVGKLEFQE